MEIRKIVKSGNSSHVVALPKEWLEKNKIGRGDKVYISESKNNSLLLEPSVYKPVLQPKKELTINIEGVEDFMIRRDIIAAYIANFAIVTLKGKNLLEHIEIIKNTIANLIAFEVVEETHDTIVTKDFLDVRTINIKRLLRRIDNILRAMIQDLPDCFQDRTMAAVIHDRDTEINRLGLMVLKILREASKNISLAKEMELTPLDIGVYMEVNIHLEKLGDKVKLIAKKLAESNKKRIDKEKVDKLIKEVERMYVDTMKAFYNNDKMLADLVALRRTHVTKTCDQFYLKHENAISAEITTHFKAITSRIIDLTRMIRYLLD